MYRLSILVAAATIFTTAGTHHIAHAADPKGSLEGLETCGKPVVFSKGMIDRTIENDGFQGSLGNSQSNRFLIATVPSPEPGTIVFVDSGGWKAFSIEPSGAIQAVRISEDLKRVVVFSMWSIEGPGSSYTVMTTGDSFDTIMCSSLEFPKELNNPVFRNEFLSFSDFNAEDSGEGVLLGSAETGEEPNQEVKWFSYQTTGFGEKWTGPFPADPQESPLQGYLKPLPKADLKVLIESLRSAAK